MILDSGACLIYVLNLLLLPREQGCRSSPPPPLQILADQLTLSQPEGADYAHRITTVTPEFSDPPTYGPDMYSVNGLAISAQFLF